MTAECYGLWDNDRIATKKSTRQADQPAKQEYQIGDRFSNKNSAKPKSQEDTWDEDDENPKFEVQLLDV
ncbi:unnamed protein product [Prunus armeniaca]